MTEAENQKSDIKKIIKEELPINLYEEEKIDGGNLDQEIEYTEQHYWTTKSSSDIAESENKSDRKLEQLEFEVKKFKIENNKLDSFIKSLEKKEKKLLRMNEIVEKKIQAFNAEQTIGVEKQQKAIRDREKEKKASQIRISSALEHNEREEINHLREKLNYHIEESKMKEKRNKIIISKFKRENIELQNKITELEFKLKENNFTYSNNLNSLK